MITDVECCDINVRQYTSVYKINVLFCIAPFSDHYFNLFKNPRILYGRA